MICIIKQEGVYQNKVHSSLVSIYNCKMAITEFESKDDYFSPCIMKLKPE